MEILNEMRRILIVGAGRSASAMLRHLLKHAEAEDLFLSVADINLANAEALVGRHARAEAIALDIFKQEA